MPKNYSNKELAEALLQILDGKGSILIDDAEYLGQGIHKLYLDRDILICASGRTEEM